MQRQDRLRSRTIPRRMGVHHAILIAALTQAPFTARADEATVSLPTLEEKIPATLQIQAATAQLQASQHLVHERESREGLQLGAGLDAGRHRDVVTSTVNYSYSNVVPRVGISYPLLGARAQLLESSQEARLQRDINSADLESQRLQLLWDLRKNYILYWQYLQQQVLTEKHVTELSNMEGAAKRLLNKGLWTQSDYLQFSSDLATARNNLSQFDTMKRDSLNDMRVVIGINVPGFTPVQPEFPNLCAATPDIYQSAEAHSSNLKKLKAQLDDVKFDQDLTSGRAINSDIHLQASYNNELNASRYGYAVVVGAEVSMPLHFMEADDANADKLNAATMQNSALTEQARAGLHLKVQDALEDYRQAQQKVEATDAAEKAADEALRESRLRFENVPQPLFGELVQKIIQEYHAALTDIEAKSTVALRANDLMLLAPDSCPGKH